MTPTSEVLLGWGVAATTSRPRREDHLPGGASSLRPCRRSSHERDHRDPRVRRGRLRGRPTARGPARLGVARPRTLAPGRGGGAPLPRRGGTPRREGGRPGRPLPPPPAAPAVPPRPRGSRTPGSGERQGRPSRQGHRAPAGRGTGRVPPPARGAERVARPARGAAGGVDGGGRP